MKVIDMTWSDPNYRILVCKGAVKVFGDELMKEGVWKSSK